MLLNRKSLDKGPKRFLLKSKDLFLVEDYLRSLKETYSDYQYCVCPDIESFCELCSSGSLFGSSNRVIVLSGIEKEHLEALLELVEGTTEDILVLVETETLLKTRAYTTLKALCNSVDIKAPTDSERAVWVRTWLTEAGLKFSDEIPGYIVSHSGSDLNKLRKEIKKLSILEASRGDTAVTKELCDEIVSADRESQYFVLMENFFKKKISEVLVEFRKVDEYSYVKLLHFMIGQVERVYKVAVYKEQGLKAEEVGEIIGVPTFIVKTKLFTVLSFYGKMKLLQLLDLFNRLDVELRTTKYPTGSVFESYLLKAFKT